MSTEAMRNALASLNVELDRFEHLSASVADRLSRAKLSQAQYRALKAEVADALSDLDEVIAAAQAQNTEMSALDG